MTPISVSVVIPVYRGERTLRPLIKELAPLTQDQTSPGGRVFLVTEVILVWDSGPGHSDEVLRDLSETYPWVRVVWLSRNFGQHAATLAGMTSSSGRWIVTMDEDGQQDPADIPRLLDCAFDTHSQLVYASPKTPPSHASWRNLGSKFAKWLFTRFLADGSFASFNSFRLMAGDVGRSVAAYTGTGVYLDVALSWVVARSTVCPVQVRDEGREADNYNFRRLTSHFGRLVVSSGTRPLLFVSWLGIAFVFLGGLATAWVLIGRLVGDVPITGWASMFVAIMLVGGATLVSLGIIAQYLGAAMNMSLGKPLYVVVDDPEIAFRQDSSG